MSATLAGAINRRRVVAAAAAAAAEAAAEATAAAAEGAAEAAGEEERLDECELPRIGENPVNQDSTMFESPRVWREKVGEGERGVKEREVRGKRERVRAEWER